jgi:hypothetical protein
MDLTAAQSKSTISDSAITVGGNFQQGDTITTHNNYTTYKGEKQRTMYLTNHTPKDDTHIVGRYSVVEKIQERFKENTLPVWLTGVGGSGKSMIATKFVVQYADKYNHLAWIDAALCTTLAKVFEKISLPNAPKNDLESIFLALNNSEKALVVIDNAHKIEDKEWDDHKRLFDNAKFNILIISRMQPMNWKETLFETPDLSEDEAVHLFEKVFKETVSPNDLAVKKASMTNKGLKNMVSRLFFNPMLIDLVAKAFATCAISFPELQEKIETKFIHYPNLTVPKKEGSEDTIAIAELIWEIFKTVDDLNLAEQAVLKCMALLPTAMFFEQDSLKEHCLMCAPTEEKFIIFHNDMFSQTDDLKTVLEKLALRGWLNKNKEAPNQYKMHPLIADVVVTKLDIHSESDFEANYITKIKDVILYNSLCSEDNLYQNNPLVERIKALFPKDKLASLWGKEVYAMTERCALNSTPKRKIIIPSTGEKEDVSNLSNPIVPPQYSALKNSLEDLLAKNKIEEVLNRLKEIAQKQQEDIKNNVVVISANYLDFKDKETMGTIDDEQAKLQHSQIVYGLQTIISGLK